MSEIHHSDTEEKRKEGREGQRDGAKKIAKCAHSSLNIIIRLLVVTMKSMGHYEVIPPA